MQHLVHSVGKEYQCTTTYYLYDRGEQTICIYPAKDDETALLGFMKNNQTLTYLIFDDMVYDFREDIELLEMKTTQQISVFNKKRKIENNINEILSKFKYRSKKEIWEKIKQTMTPEENLENVIEKVAKEILGIKWDNLDDFLQKYKFTYINEPNSLSKFDRIRNLYTNDDIHNYIKKSSRYQLYHSETINPFTPEMIRLDVTKSCGYYSS